MKSLVKKICLISLLIEIASGVSLEYLQYEELDDTTKAENSGPTRGNVDNQEETVEIERRTMDTTEHANSTNTTSEVPTNATPGSEALWNDFVYDFTNDDLDNDADAAQAEPTPLTSTHPTTTTEPHTPNTTYDEKTTTKTQFYDFESIASKIKLNVTKVKDESVWYVPEAYPCWSLPFVYGEEEKTLEYHKIFTNFPYVLKNVKKIFEEGNDSEPKISFVKKDISNNKWCKMNPCYADHTLCLYPISNNSPLCQLEYRTRPLSMSELEAMVSILNSMRNHVAKGSADEYPYLPPAANMKQVMYDYDLEMMAERWLQQCMPGPAFCISLESTHVAQLECTRSAAKCCLNVSPGQKCQPRNECFVHPVIGCLFNWFWSANGQLKVNDVNCGHIEMNTFYLAQLLWAKTEKVGCAYGIKPSGDVRVLCNFSPGAKFFLNTKYYCGLIPINDSRKFPHDNVDLMNQVILDNLGVHLEIKPNSSGYLIPKDNMQKLKNNHEGHFHELKEEQGIWGVGVLSKMYRELEIRRLLEDYSNGTMSFIARLVTQYRFRESSEGRCDSDESIYTIGEPGSLCAETGNKYHALCYDYLDPKPGYRLIAILPCIALLSLILIDLFSGVVRQLRMD